MFLPFQLNFGEVLNLLGAQGRVLPTVVPCFYCSSEAIANLDICTGGMMVHCRKCDRADDAIDILIAQACPTGDVNHREVAEYFNQNHLTSTPVQAEHFDTYLNAHQQQRELQLVYDRLYREFLNKPASYLHAAAHAFAIKTPDPASAEEIARIAFPVPAATVHEVIADLPTTSLRDPLVLVVPFSSFPGRITGLRLLGSKSSVYYTTIDSSLNTGIAGTYQIHYGSAITELLEPFVFCFSDVFTYVVYAYAALYSFNKIAPFCSIHRGYGYCRTKRVVLGSTDLPITEKTYIVVTDKINNYIISLCLRNHANLVRDSRGVFSNPLTGCLNYMNTARPATEFIKSYKDAAKYGMDMLVAARLHELAPTVRAVKSALTLNAKVGVVANRAMCIRNHMLSIRHEGVYLRDKLIANYVPAVQVTTPTQVMLEIYSNGRTCTAAVRRSDPKDMLLEAEEFVNSRGDGVAIGHLHDHSGTLWSLAEVLGNNERVASIPEVSLSRVRLKYQILLPNKTPREATPAPIGPEFYVQYDPEYLNVDKSYDTGVYIVIAVALSGIVVSRVLGAEPYSILLHQPTTMRTLTEAVGQCGIKAIRAVTPKQVDAALDHAYSKGWPLVISTSAQKISPSVLHRLIHYPGCIYLTKGSIQPFVDGTAIVLSLPDMQIDPTILSNTFSSVLALTFERFSDLFYDAEDIKTSLRNMLHVLDQPSKIGRRLNRIISSLAPTEDKCELAETVFELCGKLAVKKIPSTYVDAMAQKYLINRRQKDVEEFHALLAGKLTIEQVSRISEDEA